MWGTSSPEDKLTGDLANVIEATSIGGRRSDFFTARKLAPGNLGLLQQYRHLASFAAVHKIATRYRGQLAWRSGGMAHGIGASLPRAKAHPGRCGRVFVPSDLAVDIEWRSKNHSAVEAAVSESGLAAEV